MKKCLSRKLLCLLGAVVLVLAAQGTAMGVSININNYSFEIPTLVNGDYNQTVDQWTLTKIGPALAGGTWNPTTGDYPGEAPDGQNVAWAHSGQISQVLTAALQPNATYTLNAYVGKYISHTYEYRVQLVANTSGVVLAEAVGDPPYQTFNQVQAVYNSGPPGSLYLGEPLKIVLRSNITSDADEMDFDKVTLDYVPNPATLLLLGSGLVGLGFLGRRRWGLKR